MNWGEDMRVYVVVEEVTYRYADGEREKNIYGVYLLESFAQSAVEECKQQGDNYYAYIETHEVE